MDRRVLWTSVPGAIGAAGLVLVGIGSAGVGGRAMAVSASRRVVVWASGPWRGRLSGTLLLGWGNVSSSNLMTAKASLLQRADQVIEWICRRVLPTGRENADRILGLVSRGPCSLKRVGVAIRVGRSTFARKGRRSLRGFGFRVAPRVGYSLPPQPKNRIT